MNYLFIFLLLLPVKLLLKLIQRPTGKIWLSRRRKSAITSTLPRCCAI